MSLTQKLGQVIALSCLISGSFIPTALSNTAPQKTLQKSESQTLLAKNSQSDSNCNDKVRGFKLYDSVEGICIYTSNTLFNKHYVITINLSKGKIKNLIGTKRGNTIEAKLENYYLSKGKSNVSKNSELIAIVNGTFFNSINSEREDSQRTIPLGIRNGLNVVQNYEPDKVYTNFNHRALCFDSNKAFIVKNKTIISQAFKDVNNCRNFTGLYAPTSPTYPNEKSISSKRTFVGTRSNNSSMVFFSSDSATLKEARNILRRFKATRMAQLDGSSSALLIWKDKNLVEGKRFWRLFKYGIPSAIAIYSKEQKTTERSIFYERCHGHYCLEIKSIKITSLKSGTNGKLYSLKQIRRDYSDGTFTGGKITKGEFQEDKEPTYIYCSTSKPAIIYKDKNNYQARILNPGGFVNSATTVSNIFYWNTCHNYNPSSSDLFSPEIERKAKNLGYSLNIQENQIKIKNGKYDGVSLEN